MFYTSVLNEEFYTISSVPVSCGTSAVIVKRLCYYFLKDNFSSITDFYLRLSNPCNSNTCFGRELEKRMVLLVVTAKNIHSV